MNKGNDTSSLATLWAIRLAKIESASSNMEISGPENQHSLSKAKGFHLLEAFNMLNKPVVCMKLYKIAHNLGNCN